MPSDYGIWRERSIPWFPLFQSALFLSSQCLTRSNWRNPRDGDQPRSMIGIRGPVADLGIWRGSAEVEQPGLRPLSDSLPT